MAYEKIIIHIAGLAIYEPMATITDLFVSFSALYAYYRMRKENREGIMYSYFKYHFLTMGIATFFGGLFGHAFLYAFGIAWKLPGWLISMVSISLLERAFIAYTVQHVNDRAKYIIKFINNAELVFFMGITIYTLNFKFVEFHSGFGILAEVFPLQIYMWYKTKDKASKWVFVLVALSVTSALFFMNKIIIHPWFNHLAASHTIMTIGVFFLLKAALSLDYKPITNTTK
jgi:hypothetical protein